jgi:hypothetical protein
MSNYGYTEGFDFDDEGGLAGDDTPGDVPGQTIDPAPPTTQPTGIPGVTFVSPTGTDATHKVVYGAPQQGPAPVATTPPPAPSPAAPVTPAPPVSDHLGWKLLGTGVGAGLLGFGLGWLFTRRTRRRS